MAFPWQSNIGRAIAAIEIATTSLKKTIVLARIVQKPEAAKREVEELRSQHF